MARLGRPVPGKYIALPMRRLPILLSASALLLSGCDLFSTRDFRSKPSDVRVLPGLARAGDSVSFRATEAVWRAGAKAPEQILSRRKVTFAFGKDSLDGSDTVKALTLRVRNDSTGEILEEGTRLVRFSSEGVAMPGLPASGAARYYPLKTTAEAAAADTDAFLALPTLIIEGWNETVSMGIFTVQRLQTSVDTFDYRGHSEEAWGISESVLDGNRIVATGKYWYGASGLLKAEQSWDDFDWRGGNGAPPAKSQGPAEQAVALRRTLERL
jgi:hypothetical protein